MLVRTGLHLGPKTRVAVAFRCGALRRTHARNRRPTPESPAVPACPRAQPGRSRVPSRRVHPPGTRRMPTRPMRRYKGRSRTRCPSQNRNGPYPPKPATPRRDRARDDKYHSRSSAKRSTSWRCCGEAGRPMTLAELAARPGSRRARSSACSTRSKSRATSSAIPRAVIWWPPASAPGATAGESTTCSTPPPGRCAS